MFLRRYVLMTTMIAGSSFLFAQRALSANTARLAIYYGYPSLVNGSRGDVEKAAHVFRDYDVVVLGDGLEFANRDAGRYPEGNPDEHQRVLQIIAAVRQRNPGTRFYGYVCLGEIPWPKGQHTTLTATELEERIHLWKQMGVNGIFLDEAGYDYAAVTRKRQNLAVKIIHDLGMSAFMNAYFVEHLFATGDNVPYANGAEKNPERLPSLLDQRDLFLLESFQVKNGAYEGAAAWQARLNRALGYRRRYGSHIFVTTTTTEQEPFSAEKFNYAWWTARLYGLDGFSWGEPGFAALSNSLPDRRCRLEKAELVSSQPASTVGSDKFHFWKMSGDSVVVVDTAAHSVRQISSAGSIDSKNIEALLSSAALESPLKCDGPSNAAQ